MNGPKADSESCYLKPLLIQLLTERCHKIKWISDQSANVEQPVFYSVNPNFIHQLKQDELV